MTLILSSLEESHKTGLTVLYWDHLSLYGHMERKEILNPSSCKMGDHVKDLESRVAVNLLCN